MIVEPVSEYFEWRSPAALIIGMIPLRRKSFSEIHMVLSDF